MLHRALTLCEFLLTFATRYWGEGLGSNGLTSFPLTSSPVSWSPSRLHGYEDHVGASGDIAIGPLQRVETSFRYVTTRMAAKLP